MGYKPHSVIWVGLNYCIPKSRRPIGIIFLLLVAAYLLGSIVSRKPLNIRGQEFRFPSLKIALDKGGNFWLGLDFVYRSTLHEV